MPSYCLRCDACGIEEQHVVPISERNSIPLECGHLGRVVIKPAAMHFFRVGWYEHITSEPLFIRNRKELHEACEKHGQYSRYLIDSPVGTKFEKAWV